MIWARCAARYLWWAEYQKPPCRSLFSYLSFKTPLSWDTSASSGTWGKMPWQSGYWAPRGTQVASRLGRHCSELIKQVGTGRWSLPLPHRPQCGGTLSLLSLPWILFLSGKSCGSLPTHDKCFSVSGQTMLHICVCSLSYHLSKLHYLVYLIFVSTENAFLCVWLPPSPIAHVRSVTEVQILNWDGDQNSLSGYCLKGKREACMWQ